MLTLLTLDVDPLIVRAHGPGFAVGRRAQLALGREAFFCVRAGRRRLGLLRVLELVILVVISVFVAGIRRHPRSVATVHLQTHRRRYRGRRRRETEHRGWGRRQRR